jgi:hypothetical protein
MMMVDTITRGRRGGYRLRASTGWDQTESARIVSPKTPSPHGGATPSPRDARGARRLMPPGHSRATPTFIPSN